MASRKALFEPWMISNAALEFVVLAKWVNDVFENLTANKAGSARSPRNAPGPFVCVTTVFSISTDP